MGRIMYKTVLYHQEDAVRAEVLRIEDSGNGAVSVRSTELPKFPGRSDHVGSARSRRRWLLSWFLWDEYNVGWSRWREECSKKKKMARPFHSGLRKFPGFFRTQARQRLLCRALPVL